MCVFLFLQQHELDALGQMVPGISCEQVEYSGPTRGNLQANARGCDAAGCHLWGSEAQERMIWDKNKHSAGSNELKVTDLVLLIYHVY